MKFAELLRDPVWQFIGVVISLLSLVVAFWPNLKFTTNEPTISLCNYQPFPVFSTDPAPPEAKDRLRIIFRGKEIPVTELTITQFCLSNHTGRTIENTDFVQPLSFKSSKDVEVIYIRSFRQEPTTAVAADWRQIDADKWVMTPTVLNPDETLWFQTVYRTPDALKQKSPMELFHWQALFKGATFKVAPPINTETKWYYLQIKHEGLGLYLLIGTGLIFSFISFLLYRLRFSAAMNDRGALITLVILSALSWASAEMLVDIFYNQQVDQPVFGWLFVFILAVLAVSSVILNDRLHNGELRR